MKLFATVAMPLYNMGVISKLALEGLCKKSNKEYKEIDFYLK